MQTSTSDILGKTAPGCSLCTQQNYEMWVREVDGLGLPIGTIVIDDKWQKAYGTFEVDTEKWPDMPGFVRAQHEKGRRVLLWIPGYHAEGLPTEYCSLDEEGKPMYAHPGNPAYDGYLRGQIIRLVRETDADGFKEDWIGATASAPAVRNYGATHGIELIRQFQRIVYDALHEVKPDALMETQTPNPLFRDCSDMLRLNDIFFSTRDLPEMMRDRARIARIAGWQVIDCDNASSTTAAEWFRYALLQPHIGVPSLYCIGEMESSHERIQSAHFAYLRAIMEEYNRHNGL
jgi:hypothetical protein